MVNLQRTTCGDELDEILKTLAHEKSKSSGTYRQDIVTTALHKEFHGKCYICEDKTPTVLNTEHFKPHKNSNRDLEFDWYNLYLACGHCNNIKSAKFDDILDCMNINDDVENTIHYKALPFPKTEIKIIPLNNNVRVQSTSTLLNNIYNGTTTLKKIESDNLKEKIVKELVILQNALLEYYYNSNDEDYKNDVRNKIKNLVSRKSPFSAFKRWIILENPVYKSDFEDLLI